MKHWDLWAFIAGLIVFTAWLTIKIERWQYHRMPTFADCVDTAACIAILIVVTNWLGVWDAGPRRYSGVEADGEGLTRLASGFLKAVFLVFVPTIFLFNGMRKLGSLGRRVTIYGGFFALALVAWVIGR